MKKLPHLLFFLLSTVVLFAQNQTANYSIHLSDTPLLLKSKLENEYKSIRNDTSVQFQGKAYVLIQLNAIPSSRTKEKMEKRGIKLLYYIPNYAWVTQLELDVSQSTLEVFKVRHISPIYGAWKIPSSLRNGKIPTYAGDLKNVLVNVTFWQKPITGKLEDILKNYNITFQKPHAYNIIQIKAPLSTLLELAQHPLVQYIELTAPPKEYETIKETRHISSTYISNNPGKGYYFDGTGINIGVDESGKMNTSENPNFRSRLIRTYESGAIESHKNNVGVRMARAGNLSPYNQGVAFGATLYSGGLSNIATSISNNIVIVNRSYGWGCPSNSQTYNSQSRSYDYTIRTNPSFMITHSSGNIGGSDCYAGSPGWGNITGMAKMAKNIFNVGASSSSGGLMGFSSRGPSKDGRILPHVVAPGAGGTSYASPNLAGVFAQLNQAFRLHYNTVPNSGLLKAIIMNTADDMENPGPDFRTGFGHVNARRAYEVVKAGNFLTANISQGGNNQHLINIPSNVKELKVMVYWVDWEATSGISTRSLVNNLDITLSDPNNTIFQPWVLNPTFVPNLLNKNATRATDSLNNHEQITIKNPITGNYELTVNGTMIPQGPQSYFMTYEFVMDEIVVTHPHGGEQLVPNETERIRWNACDSTLTFNLLYSNNDGLSWSSIVTGVNSNLRWYDWVVPQDLTDKALIRIERGLTQGQSDTTFSISKQPQNLELMWSCADSSLFHWDEFPNADGYILYQIIGDYMDSVAYTTSNSIVINGLSISETEYFSIAVVQNGIVSRRINAISRAPNNQNCNIDDIGVSSIIRHGDFSVPSCMTASNNLLEVVVHNWGANTIDSIPIAYRINGGTVYYDTIFSSIPSRSDLLFTFNNHLNFSLGANLIKVWTQHPNDQLFDNDTTSVVVHVYPSANASSNLLQTFDVFPTCSGSWGCTSVNCNLQDGWYNIPNGNGDEIDWRTLGRGTATANTGPSSDHTSGNGKFLYLESSGPCTNRYAKLHSPCIDLNGIKQAELSFWFYAWGSGVGSLHVDVIADGILNKDIMTPVNGSQGNQWLLKTVDLSTFSNQQIVIIIRGSTGHNYYSDLAIDDINISTSPIAEFTSNETQLCNNAIITLDNTSLYATTYEWSFLPNTITFENGTDSNSANPQVSFNAPGDYSIQLIASNTIGTDTLTLTNYIHAWESHLPLDPIAICNYDPVIVQANNNGVTVAYHLNDSIVYTGTNASHYFENAQDGDSIHLIYTVNNSCSLSSDTVSIDFLEINTAVTQIGLQLNANAVNAQYQWLDCLNHFTPILNENTSTFTPTLNGEYAVQIIEENCVDTSNCHSILTLPIAEFTSDETQLCNNAIITLDNTSLYATTYEWSFLPNTITFENGTDSSSVNPQVGFNAPGDYSIQLIASNTIGTDTLTLANYIHVWESHIQLDPIAICNYDSVIVQVKNNGVAVAYHLNDSIVYTGTNASHYFENAQDGDSIHLIYTVNNSCSLSSDTVSIDFLEVNTAVTPIGIQLNANAVNVQYQWLDCLNNYNPIFNETNPTFTPTLNGEYAVQITEENCVDTSHCFIINSVSVNSLNQQEIISYFPNPTKGGITLNFNQNKNFVKVKIYTTTGQLLFTSFNKNVKTLPLELPKESGLYFLNIQTETTENQTINIIKL